MSDLSDLLDFCLARGTPFSLVCFAEKSFKFYKISLYYLSDLSDFCPIGHSLNLISDAKLHIFFDNSRLSARNLSNLFKILQFYLCLICYDFVGFLPDRALLFLVCFAEKSFKSFKIVHYLFILFVRFVRFLPDRALLFLVCFAEKSFKIVQNLFILFVRFGRFVRFLPDRALLFLVCFAEKSFKIVQNLFILFVRFVRFVRFLPDRALLFSVAFRREIL